MNYRLIFDSSRRTVPMPLYCKGIDFEKTYDINVLIKNLDTVGMSALDGMDHLYMTNWISDQLRSKGPQLDDAEQLFSRIYLQLDTSSLFAIQDTLINPSLNPMYWKKTWSACVNEERVMFLIDGFIEYGKQQCMQQRIAQRDNVWNILSQILPHDDFTASCLLTSRVSMDVDSGLQYESYIERFKQVWNLTPVIDIQPYMHAISTTSDISNLSMATALNHKNSPSLTWADRQLSRVFKGSEFKDRPHLAIVPMLFIEQMGAVKEQLYPPLPIIDLPLPQGHLEI